MVTFDLFKGRENALLYEALHIGGWVLRQIVAMVVLQAKGLLNDLNDNMV